MATSWSVLDGVLKKIDQQLRQSEGIRVQMDGRRRRQDGQPMPIPFDLVPNRLNRLFDQGMQIYILPSQFQFAGSGPGYVHQVSDNARKLLCLPTENFRISATRSRLSVLPPSF